MPGQAGELGRAPAHIQVGCWGQGCWGAGVPGKWPCLCFLSPLRPLQARERSFYFGVKFSPARQYLSLRPPWPLAVLF